jgi:hypothetical protein
MNMDLNSMRVLKKEKDHRKVEVRVAVANMMPKVPQAKERKNGQRF